MLLLRSIMVAGLNLCTKRNRFKLRLHTAINQADFVFWWMWFNGSPTKARRHFLTNALCHLLTYITCTKIRNRYSGSVIWTLRKCRANCRLLQIEKPCITPSNSVYCFKTMAQLTLQGRVMRVFSSWILERERKRLKTHLLQTWRLKDVTTVWFF